MTKKRRGKRGNEGNGGNPQMALEFKKAKLIKDISREIHNSKKELPYK